MKQKKEKPSCCSHAAGQGCCSVAAIVNIDEKGQLVLPKDIRKQLDLKAGDRLAIISLNKAGSTCCLMMMKANELNGVIKIKIDDVLQNTEE